jgi:hypothetical protein
MSGFGHTLAFSTVSVIVDVEQCCALKIGGSPSDTLSAGGQGDLVDEVPPRR